MNGKPTTSPIDYRGSKPIDSQKTKKNKKKHQTQTYASNH